MLTTMVSAWAEGEITGLKIDMKDASKGYVQILFTDSPVVTHNLEESQVLINATGIETQVLNMDDIKDMTFLNIDKTITGIENIFSPSDANAPKGIYTLGGKRVQKMQDLHKGQVYIINGNKVLVK